VNILPVTETVQTVPDIAPSLLAGGSPAPVANAGDSRIGTPAGARPQVVLVIDDDPLVRMVIEAALESFGQYEIWTASDGATGLAMVEAARPDFVILDLLIPGKNGFAVLEELQRRGKALDGIHVIVTSGLAGAGTLERLAALGAPEVLPKPFRLADLRRALAESVRAAPTAA
jgi:CheY-like chemotaxis protein